MKPVSRFGQADVVALVTSGNFIEMFDFFLFGLYASHIAATFFPAKDELVSLLSAFIAFGAGFLMRPLGAIVLGAYVDAAGRRKGLVVTLGLMAAGTLLITLTPGYARIGLMAPVLVVLGRLLQGFSAGAELGGVSVYLSEIAAPNRKGFMVAWQSASQQVAIIVAASLGLGLDRLLSAQDIATWGWRIPFAFGCALIPFLLYIRSRLAETPEFLLRTRHPTFSEIIASMMENWRLVAGGAMLVSLTTVSFYLITVYTPTYGKSVLKLSEVDSLVVTVCVGFSNFLWLPVIGALSDRIGRRPILLFYAVLAVLTPYPALTWLASEPSFSRMVIVELWLSFIYAGYNAALVVALIEIMPRDIRTTGFSLAYSLATAVFGGFTAAISTWLIQATHNKASPGLWMSSAAACALVAAILLAGSFRSAKLSSRAV
jgi:MHS family citrate/tricarballylate:H+ symporter-like MFS transporter